MKYYSADKIKNIAFLGHGGEGKTTLADAILCYGKAVERIGNTVDGTSVFNFDPEEKKRGTTLSTAVYALEAGDKKINLLDAPGLFDFAGGVSEALAAADSVVITVSGKSGITVGARQAFSKAKAYGKSIAFFVGMLDSSHAHFYKVMSALTEAFGSAICPVIIPYVEEDVVKCFVNLIENKAYTYSGFTAKECDMPAGGEIEEMRNMMIEAVAGADEELMEKFFGGEELTKDEIIKGLKAGIISGDICPVFGGIQLTGEAVSAFADNLFELMPSAAEKTYETEDGAKKFDESGEPALLIFKTIADPFVGKLSYFKVLSGKVKGDLKLKNARGGDEERLAKVMFLKGAKQEDASEIGAGDIGSVSKLGSAITGDTLSQSGKIAAKMVEFPVPTLKMAVYPTKKGEEEKVSTGLSRLAEEDPTIKIYNDKETHELILATLGEQHVDVITSRIKSKFGTDMQLKAPKIAYRETIRKAVKVQGRHKKQSGGHGQFGDVWIEFEPCDSDTLVFEEKIFGGAVPKNFFPAVEKGLRDSTEKGVLAGYPMVGIKATLVDGSYHPVDSSEMAFKTAASIAFKEGVSQANPVLLEPIGTLKAVVPGDVMGDVMGDITKRRGRILGMNPLDNNMQEVVAEVPMAEMSDFSTAMRSITQGTATFTLDFERYEDVPANIAQKVIEESKKDKEQ